MRLKDADELLYQIQTTYCKDCKDCDKDKEFFHCCIEQIIGIIKLAPIVDPWHYPSKGEYPTEGEKVLILYKDDDGVLDTCLGDYSYCEPAEDESFKADFYWNKENLDPLDDRQVECWQYIVPPEEV